MVLFQVGRNLKRLPLTRELAWTLAAMPEGETSGGYRIRPYKIPAGVHAVGAESISARNPTDPKPPDCHSEAHSDEESQGKRSASDSSLRSE